MALQIGDFKDGIVHFIGCGGAGMAPLALILAERGFKVSGSDLELSDKTEELRRKGAEVFHGHAAENIPAAEKCLVVYSSAVKPGNPEMAQAAKAGFPRVRRGEMLAMLAAAYRRPVAISGSHGKTTVTAMLVHILRECGVKCGAMIGGKVNSGLSAAAGDGDIFVTEVDESDGTHALMNSFLGLVTNVEDDHCWSVGGTEQLFRNFSDFACKSRHLIYVAHPNSDRLFAEHADAQRLDPDKILAAGYFKYLSPAKQQEWRGYQSLNAAIALAAAIKLGADPGTAEKALESFPGVSRRMTCHLNTPSLTVMEDYAHHPTELAAALDSLRGRFPGHHFRVVFQPHRYARLRQYFDDFTRILRIPDSVFISPVFAAWVEKGELGSEELAKQTGPTACFISGRWEDMPAILLKPCASRPLLLAIIGAGDIEQLIPHVLSAANKSAKDNLPRF
ncbi:MAG: Mur ligase domain-containing protein [Victivallaceae bacterium]|jgi:UDP-N-acetylmuramate--alanine ligase